MGLIRHIAFCILLAAVFCSCRPENEVENEDLLLARAHNKSLYLSELDGMFPEGINSNDSSLIINAYVQRWIKEALLLNEAERNIPSDLNIDKLVRDYRASLIRHNYEMILVEQFLDSTITQAELIEFYEKNKQQYQLETPIVRCHFIKVPLPVPEAEELRRLWNSNKEEDFGKLLLYCNKYAEAHLLEDSIWYNIEDIALEFPKGTLTANNIRAKRDFSQRDDQYQFYFKAFEKKNRKDIAPLSYIENQARKVILRKRKIKLLEDKKEEMYKMELRRNNIWLYTK